MRVADWMSTDVLVAAPGMSIAQARALLDLHDAACLPVVEEGRVVGLLTRPDLVRADGESVRDAMRTPAPILAPAQGVEEAALLLLGHEVDALPVVEAGALVGLFSLTGALHGLLQLRGKGPLDIAAAVVQAEGGAPAPEAG
jgi:CBS domain-containing protein